MSPRDTSLVAAFSRVALLMIVVAATGGLVGALFLPTTLAVTDVVAAVDRDVFDVPPLPDSAPPPENSFIYAADGTQLAEISYEEKRIIVELEDIPSVAVDALLATEDAEFWEHRGVNHEAIIRAAITNARAGGIEQGGSTVTQQLVKQIWLSAEQSYDRKIKEALWAIELEKRWPKERILEEYLNRVYYGNGVYGIGTAARFYFNKTVDQLTLSDAALLAGVIRSPTVNEPVGNPNNAQRRRDIVLDQMQSHGFVTSAQAEQAKSVLLVDQLDVQPQEAPDEPFWTDWITRLLTNESAAKGLGSQVEALEAMGEDPEDRIATVFQGGLRIHTTLDLRLHRLAEDALSQHLTDPLRDPMGGIVSVEPGTGRIVAMALGPKDYGTCSEPVEVDDAGRQLCDKTKFNPIVPADEGSRRAGRQPGSSFKPYVIAAALEAGFPPGWQIDATGPQTIPGCDNGGPWTVNNSGGNGLRDMYSGVAGSSNVFHARLIKEVGPEKVADMAFRLGIRRSNLDNPPCSLALGAREVFPLEMASAYATFANRGEYCAPFAITRIEDREGNLLYEHSRDCEQVVEPSIADRVVDIMQGPVQAGGTAPIANLSPYPTRGKTGTTNDYRDAWFVGYVKQLATAAWMGYENGVTWFDSLEQALDTCGNGRDDRGTERGERDLLTDPNMPDGLAPACVETRLMRNVTVSGTPYSRIFGGTISAPMWKTYMSQAVQAWEPESFPRPGPLPGTTVPDVIGLETLAEAEALIEEADLNPLVQAVDDYRPAGMIVGQNPEPGTRLPAGRAVVIMVSNGEGAAPQVPDVIGMTEREAQALLAEAGYGVRVVNKWVVDPDKDGIVLNQNPRGGEELAPEDGATVVIQVGRLKPGAGDGDSADSDGPGNGNGNGNGPPDDGSSDGSDGSDSGDGTSDGGTEPDSSGETTSGT